MEAFSKVPEDLSLLCKINEQFDNNKNLATILGPSFIALLSTFNRIIDTAKLLSLDIRNLCLVKLEIKEEIFESESSIENENMAMGNLEDEVKIHSKGLSKKNLLFQNLIYNLLVNRWSQEAVLFRTWCTNEYTKS